MPAFQSEPRRSIRSFLSYAWHNDLCFPGQNRLAKDVGMGIASVNRYVKELEKPALSSR